MRSRTPTAPPSTIPTCYAFIHIIDSMFNQHAKWLKLTNHIPWRRPIASLNYLLSSHIWRRIKIVNSAHGSFRTSGEFACLATIFGLAGLLPQHWFRCSLPPLS
jgi:hypothetical protein